jgi:hypothetical protein
MHVSAAIAKQAWNRNNTVRVRVRLSGLGFRVISCQINVYFTSPLYVLAEQRDAGVC